MLENYPDILSSQEVCQLLKISLHTLYNLIKTGELPARKVGGKYKIAKKSILNFINN